MNVGLSFALSHHRLAGLMTLSCKASQAFFTRHALVALTQGTRLICTERTTDWSSGLMSLTTMTSSPSFTRSLLFSSLRSATSEAQSDLLLACTAEPW